MLPLSRSCRYALPIAVSELAIHSSGSSEIENSTGSIIVNPATLNSIFVFKFAVLKSTEVLIPASNKPPNNLPLHCKETLSILASPPSRCPETVTFPELLTGKILNVSCATESDHFPFPCIEKFESLNPAGNENEELDISLTSNEALAPVELDALIEFVDGDIVKESPLLPFTVKFPPFLSIFTKPPFHNQ
ncbi:hypothetical protein O5O45_29630 [Hahella aquimaris]|uniref:hypothetical protein n=1 Tax=Hahella sp. HNIBRBA332 TaxID=3015983 RepID=UPI00273CED08|nr:hypothetical protein [Hahella sp. HNIBRBA332]WLQ13888.1 hypothetical protein O5O45_29630 [Hahella sp. HNIBRBA332]